MKIQNGWLEGVRRVISPNRDARPADAVIDLLVIHGISLPPGEFGGPHIEALFTNTLDPAAHPYFAKACAARVSSHVLIRRSGELIPFVPFHERAWHAGASCFENRTRCNDFSIGIELEGSDDDPFTGIQYEKLAELTRALQEAYPIEDIVGHSDIAPVRKTDPGPCFDWQKFRSLVSAG